MEGCWILSKAFSASNDVIVWLFCLFVYVVYYAYQFSYVEPALHPWNESYLIMVDSLFDVSMFLV